MFTSISSSKKRRKGHGKALRDIDDIICLVKETDPEELPIFVARDLHKLPPVLFDHVDVTRLLKDMLKMRNDLNHIAEHYATNTQLDSLRSEIENLKTNPTKNPINHKINTKRGACLIESFEYSSGPMGLTPEVCVDSEISRSHPSISSSQKNIQISPKLSQVEGKNTQVVSCAVPSAESAVCE